jgi:hypothetical protein
LGITVPVFGGFNPVQWAYHKNQNHKCHFFLPGTVVMGTVGTARDIPEAKKGERKDVPVAVGGTIIGHGGKGHV